jgi:hypothetical protein
VKTRTSGKDIRGDRIVEDTPPKLRPVDLVAARSET